MNKMAEQKFIRALIYIGAISVSLFLTPNYSSEPVDLPKLLILVTLGGALIAYTVINFRAFIEKKFRIILIFLGLLLADFTILLFNGHSPFNQEFYGTYGRNTGYLAYLSLIFVFLASIIYSNKIAIRNTVLILIFTGLANCCYGFLQTTHHDPIKWNNPYNSLIGFLGNPDFSSAFLGIAASAVFSLLLSKNVSIRNKVLLFVYELISLLLIVRSHAQQGLIVLGLGIALSLLVYLAKAKQISRIILYSYIAGTTLIGSVVLLGIFRIGPLADKLYKVSVRQRGFYWHAAVEMLKSNPLFGIGIDSYGDNYLKYRSKNAEFFSSATQSNAAHNVYLDFASNGGIPLIAIYLAVNIYVLYRAIKKLRKMENFDSFFTGVFVAWIGYQAQSIISINQLGLAIWGWILGGLIVGYSFFGNEERIESKSKKRYAKVKNDGVTATILVTTLGGVIGFLSVLPMFQADHRYRVATSTRNANEVIAAATTSPIDLNRTLNAAQLLANNRLIPQALGLANKTVTENPKFYNGWVFISQLTDPNSSDHKIAIKRMKELNPRDKKIK